MEPAHRLAAHARGRLRGLHRSPRQDFTELAPDFGPFDAVVAFFSLLMLPRAQIPVALARLHRVLRPGGLLALGMVEADVDDVPIPFLGVSVHVSGFFLEDLRRHAARTGFEILEQHSRKYAPAGRQALPEIQPFLYCRKTP